jgi:predicted RNA methylase
VNDESAYICVAEQWRKKRKNLQILLDLGAGTGYFAIPAARMTRKSIYAMEIEPNCWLI